MRRAGLSACLAGIAACLGQAAYYYGRLPEQVPSHFGASGAANSWAPKEFFVGLYVGAVALIAVLFLVNAYALQAMPDARINLPNKDYWLAPERRAETFAWLGGMFLWFATATLALFFDMFGQAFRAALSPLPVLPHPKTSIACYVAFAAAWVLALLRRFRRAGA